MRLPLHPLTPSHALSRTPHMNVHADYLREGFRRGASALGGNDPPVPNRPAPSLSGLV